MPPKEEKDATGKEEKEGADEGDDAAGGGEWRVPGEDELAFRQLGPNARNRFIGDFTAEFLEEKTKRKQLKEQHAEANEKAVELWSQYDKMCRKIAVMDRRRKTLRDLDINLTRAEKAAAKQEQLKKLCYLCGKRETLNPEKHRQSQECLKAVARTAAEKAQEEADLKAELEGDAATRKRVVQSRNARSDIDPEFRARRIAIAQMFTDMERKFNEDYPIEDEGDDAS